MPTGKAAGHFAATAKALSLFKHAVKPKSPPELVRLALEALRPLAARNAAPTDKALEDLERYLDEMVFKLYGDSDAHPNSEDVASLTVEIFKGDFLSALIRAVPRLKESSRQPAVQIVASLQSNSRQAASDYLKAHTEVLDLLLQGYEEKEVALFYGSMLRDCLRHQEAAKHVLQSESFFSLFLHIQSPQFEIASDAAATFKELLLRHKSTASEFLVHNCHKFFVEYNSLLESQAYVTRRTSVKFLAEMLQDRSYSGVLEKYVMEAANLRPVMNVLKDSSKTIQLDGYQIFKMIALHPAKSDEISHILTTNKDKLQRVLATVQLEKASEQEVQQFENDKKALLSSIHRL